MRFLVIGTSSIGRRHTKNLTTLGHDVEVADIVEDNFEEAVEEGATKTHLIPDDRMTIPDENYDAVLICTPAKTHYELAMTAIRNENNIFVEKPLCFTKAQGYEITNEATINDVKLMCGCNLRFENGIQLIKNLLSSDTIGDILAVDAHYGHYLPLDDKDYEEKIKTDQKGWDVDLRASIHEIDLLISIFGKPIYWDSKLHTFMDFGVYDRAITTMNFKNDIIATVESNYLEFGYNRTIKFLGKKGTIIWDFNEHTVRLRTEEIDAWRVFKTDPDINSMYMTEMEYFTGYIEGKYLPLSYMNGTNALTVIQDRD